MACSHLMVGDRAEGLFINAEISLHFQAEMGEVEPCHKRCINPALPGLLRLVLVSWHVWVWPPRNYD